jgi:hypothetical protein
VVRAQAKADTRADAGRVVARAANARGLRIAEGGAPTACAPTRRFLEDSMLNRARFVSSFSFLALAASLVTACGGSTGGNGSGGSGGGAGGGSVGCETVCTAVLTCPGIAPCTLPDPSAAIAACVTACGDALGKVPASEAAALVACDSCVSQNGGGTCSGFMNAGNSAQCMSACSGSAYEQALTDWGNAVSAATAGNTAFVCTDGEDLLAGSSCVGGGDDTTTCTNGCCNGTSCAQPTVEISCSGSDPSALTCTCTAGKSKGKVLSATTCDAATSLDPWATCNE